MAEINPEELAAFQEAVGAVAGQFLRDMFAATAPQTPQWNFTPTMPTTRPEPLFVGSALSDVPPVNLDELDKWDSEYTKQLAIQWPWAWADAMLAERAKENP